MENNYFNRIISYEIDKIKNQYADKNLKDLRLKNVLEIAKALDKISHQDEDNCLRGGMSLHKYLDGIIADESNIEFLKAYKLYEQYVAPVQTFLVRKHDYRTNVAFLFDGLIGLFFDFILFIFTDWHSKIYYIPICILIMLGYSLFHHLKEKKKGKVLNF
ncbi:MAG: hypothetical protein MUE81_10420 [Thermoflexibacter sp.]|jgi:hypothetical protein|nr:hypothetical protein [Thermoflexibacter sp.]